MAAIKINFHLFAGAFFLSLAPLASGEGVCHRCEEIRAHNVEHHQNYEYYEDYTKEDEETAVSGKPAEKAEKPAAQKGNK